MSSQRDPRDAGHAGSRLHNMGGEAGPAEPDAGDSEVAAPTAGVPQGDGHVGGDLDWVPSDEDDPDGGSGRTEADDGGYLPGEGTGRPVDR